MFFWLSAPGTVDAHGAFRSVFLIPRETSAKLQVTASAAFRLSLDGRMLALGPVRYPYQCLEYEELAVDLPAGEHVMAFHAHYYGVETRLWPVLPPFVWCRLTGADGREIPLGWKGVPLRGYESEVRRVNPQLGWIEWGDTAKDPKEWTALPYRDDDWADVSAVDPGLSDPLPADLGPLSYPRHHPPPGEQGFLAERFGYERDDIPARFLLRELRPDQASLPAEGVWRRYDLGRVRLAAPRFVLDLPAGAVVEIAAAEWLTGGRVAPHIPLSAGPSCNLDHYVARGGVQEFFPVAPKGGRFWEVHVLAEPDKIRFVAEEFVEKIYYGEATGSFRCSDPLLDRIWQTGVETFRACCEDALTDNPTRERGQWLGDAATVGMEIAAAGFDDLRPVKRSLVHSALCAREDGLVAGLTPGGVGYLASYALLWTEACWRYFQHTGDRGFLEKMLPCARRNLDAFLPSVGPDGLADFLAGGDAWIFIDWAYFRPKGTIDPAYNLYFLRALHALGKWAALLEDSDLAEKCCVMEKQIRSALQQWLADRLEADGWEQVGWHAGGLLLGSGLIPAAALDDCVGYLKRHIWSCFPNRTDAPRLGAPGARNPRLISPFFCHFVLPALIDAGEVDFVIDQFRACWGWALEEGRTTWVEVFDTRWSHCHQWSGCPTWILSRYLLGLHPRADRAPGDFDFRFAAPTSLYRVAGRLPGPRDGETIQVQWERKEGQVRYSLETSHPIRLLLPGRTEPEIIENSFSSVQPE